MEWAAFYNLEPFGDARASLNAGVIAATIANVHRDKKKRSRPFLATDFAPFVDTDGKRGKGARKPVTNPKEWKSIKSMFASYAGGKKQDDLPEQKRRRR